METLEKAETLEFKNELPAKKKEYALIIADKKAKYKDLKIIDISDNKGYAIADAARKDLKQMRVGVEKFCKSQRDELNRYSKAIIATEKEIIAEFEPLEISLKSMTDEIDSIKSEIRAKKEKEEADRLAAIAKKEADRLAKIESDRIAAIEAQQKIEAERLAQLQKDIDAKNKKEQERLAAIQIEQDKIKKEQDKKDAEIKLQQQKIEDEKAAISNAKLKEEQDKQRAIELEKAKEVAAKKALEDQEKKRISDEKEAARLEALKPDKEKLMSLIAKIQSIEYPKLSDTFLGDVSKNANTMLVDVVNYIKESL